MQRIYCVVGELGKHINCGGIKNIERAEEMKKKLLAENMYDMLFRKSTHIYFGYHISFFGLVSQKGIHGVVCL